MNSSFPANDIAKLIKAKWNFLTKNSKNPKEEVAVEVATGFGLMRVARLEAVSPEFLELGVFEDETQIMGQIIIAHVSQCEFKFSRVPIPAKQEQPKEFIVGLFSEGHKQA